jgi:hypothetical protein
MEFTPGVAKSIAEQFTGADPVLSAKGQRKGDHIKYAYRFAYHGELLRHISIVRKPTEDGVTVYINKWSSSNVAFPSGKIGSARVKMEYPKGSQGKTGDKGLSSAAGGLPSLAPMYNDVLRLSVASKEQFRELLVWYFENPSAEDALEDIHQNVPPQASGITVSDSISSESIMASENEPSPSTGTNGIRRPMALEDFQSQLDRRSVIGEAGELIALEYERARLRSKDIGCPDPDRYVKYVALTDVGRGYDIESSWPGHERFIEVKSSTNSGNDIFMSDNEKRVLTVLGDRAWLYRVVVDADGDGDVVLRLNNPMNKIPETNISTAVWRIHLPKSDE